MRYLVLCSMLWLGAAGCDDEDAHVDQHADGHPHDSKDAGSDAATGSKDAGTAQATGLSRPSLPRPPKGLPPELRPPR